MIPVTYITADGASHLPVLFSSAERDPSSGHGGKPGGRPGDKPAKKGGAKKPKKATKKKTK